MKNIHRTLKGRVVYDRKKHFFTVKRLGNICSTLYTAEKGNMAEWRYIVMVATMAWNYHAVKEGKLSEISYWAEGYDVCDPIIRIAQQFYNLLEWLIKNVGYLESIPYVGVAAGIAHLVLSWLYDRNMHSKLNYMVADCQRKSRGEKPKERWKTENGGKKRTDDL